MLGPSREDPTFHGASLKDSPRVPCSSLLIRILSIPAARAAMRRKTPLYADRSACAALRLEVDLLLKFSWLSGHDVIGLMRVHLTVSIVSPTRSRGL